MRRGADLLRGGEHTAPAADISPGLARCKALAPTGSATQNRQQIVDCLAGYGIAQLAAGTHAISDGIDLPAKAELVGIGQPRPAIVLVGSPAANHVLATADGSRIARLVVDGGGLLKGKAHAAVVHMVGSNAQVDDCELKADTQMPAAGDTTAALYIIGDKVSGNVVSGSSLHHSFYGVIFRGGLTKSHVNTVKSCEIHDLKCDSVTFAGYGELLDTTIHSTGFDCENGPIPGGGIYSLDQKDGGRVEGNTIHDTCGHGIDLDGVAGFIIRSNTIYDPGYQWGGTYPYCVGAQAISLIDVSQSVIEKNSAKNNRASNRVELFGDPNAVFSKTITPKYTDLPHGSKQVIAFVLSRRRNTGTLAIANTIRDNVLQASCSPSTLCVGLGYFASRGTGFGSSGAWSASTTSYFTKNNPFGSQVGSKRCGGNWYAANDACGAIPTGDCNIDDEQHNPPVGDWARNDQCASY